MIKCFDFECVKCEITRKDIYLSDNEKPPKCPMCKQPMNKALSGGGNFVLKGSGWYSKGG